MYKKEDNCQRQRLVEVETLSSDEGMYKKEDKCQSQRLIKVKTLSSYEGLCRKEDNCQKQSLAQSWELQALMEEYLGKMVHSGRRGGLNSGPCLRETE